MREIWQDFYDRWPRWFGSKQWRGFECDEGWYPLLWKLCRDIEYHLWMTEVDMIVSQVKEKFGGLRFFVHFENLPGEEDIEASVKVMEVVDHIYALIDDAETESNHTCEECGKPDGQIGNWRHVSAWKCLCPTCQVNPQPKKAA